MKYNIIHLLFFFCCIIYFSCSNENKIISEGEAIQQFSELDAEDGAEYYIKNREVNLYFDSLYLEAVVPLLEDCTLDELKRVYSIIKSTPSAIYVEDIYDEKRDEYLFAVKNELDSLATSHYMIFQNEIVPILELGIDSLLTEDLENVIDDYSGGFMNVRKLALFGGRGPEEFANSLQLKIDTTRYNDLISEAIDDFSTLISDYELEYYQEATEDLFDYDFKVEIPETKFYSSSEITTAVYSYNDREKSGMITDAIKDFVIPIALDVVTGGMAEVVTAYEVVMTVGDIAVTYDDIVNMKPTSEDLLKFACIDVLEQQIKVKVLDSVSNQVLKHINSSYRKLYQDIEKKYSDINKLYEPSYKDKIVLFFKNSAISISNFWEDL